MMSLYNKYKTTIKSELKNKLGKPNIHQVPEVSKIVVSMGIGSLATRKGMKEFADLEKNLATITGQKPSLVKSRKAISNFKLRENMPVMLMCTLRGQRAYDFIEKLVTIALPRIRDFKGLNAKKFDGKGNYSIGFQSQSIFAELNPEDIPLSHGVQVNIVTNTDKDSDALALFKELGFIFA